MYSALLRCNLFADDGPDTLQNIMSKDLATLEIQQSLLTAKECGQTQVDEFLNQTFAN